MIRKTMDIKEQIKNLVFKGWTVEEIAEELDRDGCMADSFKEACPTFCNENADCYDCWKQRINNFIEEDKDSK